MSIVSKSLNFTVFWRFQNYFCCQFPVYQTQKMASHANVVVVRFFTERCKTLAIFLMKNESLGRNTLVRETFGRHSCDPDILRILKRQGCWTHESHLSSTAVWPKYEFGHTKAWTFFQQTSLRSWSIQQWVGWQVIFKTVLTNEGESAASFCRQVAALLPDMFWSFYLVKNHKYAKNSTTTKAREKISTDLASLEFLKMRYVWLNLKAMKFYLIILATHISWQPW